MTDSTLKLIRDAHFADLRDNDDNADCPALDLSAKPTLASMPEHIARHLLQCPRCLHAFARAHNANLAVDHATGQNDRVATRVNRGVFRRILDGILERRQEFLAGIAIMPLQPALALRGQPGASVSDRSAGAGAPADKAIAYLVDSSSPRSGQPTTLPIDLRPTAPGDETQFVVGGMEKQWTDRPAVLLQSPIAVFDELLDAGTPEEIVAGLEALFDEAAKGDMAEPSEIMAEIIEESYVETAGVGTLPGEAGAGVVFRLRSNLAGYVTSPGRINIIIII